MSRSLLRGGMLFSLISLIFVLPMHGQQALPALAGENTAPTTAVAETGSTQTSSSTRLIPFSDTLPGQPDGALTITFTIYPDQQSTNQLWSETQVVQLTGGKYTVLLGSSSPQGLPFELFAGDAAHWLGVQVNGSERRFLLVSVPYAMKAVEAERLGGLLPSDFVTAAQLTMILKNSAGAGVAVAGQQPASASGTFRAQAAAAGTTPQPATDFTDNNTSEVLLITQQGTGYAIHAISSGDAALFAENSNVTGTALKALASASTGTTIGILGQASSPTGVAGVFESLGGGEILSLRANGTEVAGVDGSGNLRANTIFANSFSGSGAGLFNIPPSAVGATANNFPDTVVARDASGSFFANTIFANNFSGSGAGLFNIPPSAVGATPNNFPNTVVARDASGSFFANTIFANTFSGSGAGLFNIPPSAVGATANNFPDTVVARDASGSFFANTIFANNFSGSGAGLFNIPPSAVGATANNFPNTVVARDASGSFFANTIFANAFSGSGAGLFNVPPAAVGATENNFPNTVVARDANGSFFAGVINANGISASAAGGTAIHGDSSGIGVQASSQSGIALWAGSTANDSTGTALLLSHASLGKLISGGVGTSTNLASESFSVDASGNVSYNGSLMTPYETSGTWFAGSLVKLTSNPGNFGAGTVAMTSAGDISGAIGVITGLPAGTTRIQVAQTGEVFCNFDGPATAGHYVGISKTTAGLCTDVGPVFPNDGQQVVGRVLASFAPSATRILLFGPEQHSSGGGTLTSINTGAGLTGGPITSSGTISIANAGVSNNMLQNNTITVADGIGIGGGGTVALGGTVTLTNLGALSFNGRVGNIVPTFADYSFSQISGRADASQMPPTVVLSNQSNTFTANQTINGSLTANGVLATGNSTPFSSVASVFDTSAAGNQPAFSASSSNNPAALFLSNAPTILTVGTATHGVLSVTFSGASVTGSLSATSFAGEGSGLTNVNASTLAGTAVTDLATTSALSAETSARQTADATLQASISTETTARQAADASLSASISAETTARQSDVANLQTSINNVSSADAKLAASNTFSAGMQDFSGAGATLPVRTVLSANTPPTCVASKELLIKTDAPAGQQLFICDASGTTWNLVGDGASGGVTSFNGRSGSVTPATGDYSFSQISGSAAASQLPASTVYNNQANTFGASQTVNGTLTANLFSGSGAGLVNVNAAALNGLPSNAFAQLNAINTFTAEQVLSPSNAVNPSLNMPSGTAPATPLAGDVWNSGGVIQYRDNASTTRSLVSTPQNGGLQMLKIIGSITPAPVANQTCAEQSFSVAGLSTGDVLLAVLQPGNSSPGTNIAIGGWRVSATNTVAIQFCNVSRNNSTPVSGAYTFAVMR